MEREALQHILAEILRVDPNEVCEDTTLAQDLDADSLDLYQVLLRVEEQFGPGISTRSFFSARTVGDLLRLIRRKQNGESEDA